MYLTTVLEYWQQRSGLKAYTSRTFFAFFVFIQPQQIAPRIAGPLLYLRVLTMMIIKQVSALERAARADERAHSHRSKDADDDEDKRVREVRPLVSFLLKTSPGCVRYDFG